MTEFRPALQHSSAALRALDPAASARIRALLLLCARPRLDQTAAADLHALAEGGAESGMSWADLMRAAADHAVVPQVCARLFDFAGDALPSFWRMRISEAFHGNIQRNLRLTAELFRALGALEGRGVRATPFKGPTLAAMAYGDIALRQFADLDVVVPHAEIGQAHLALADLGYRAERAGAARRDGGPMPGQYAYWNAASGTQIELHTEATLRYFPRRLALEPLLKRRREIAFAGGGAQTFCAEDLIVLLSVHGSKHFWDRLCWIADLAALAENRPELDWGTALEQARSLGAGRMVLLGAGLAEALLEAPLPPELQREIERDGATRRLRDQLRERFLAPGRPEPGMLRRFHFRVRVAGKTGEGLRYVTRLATTPAETDSAARRTGKPRPVLDRLLRPVRLARIYGWRTP